MKEVYVSKDFALWSFSKGPPQLSPCPCVHPVTALQSQYSLIERVHENGALDTCEKLGISFVAYCPLGRALLTDYFNEWSRFAEADRRTGGGFFKPEALATNLQLVTLIREWAMKKDATPAQISLAGYWHKSPLLFPFQAVPNCIM